ncbi:dethiobiotin synthase [Planosporangium mesophilum]|uniref:ATP-dependent dethiobiotin synthetase BioD n=1 Tax=Planosporangium mesophilum TaxID=689768 RepID=A0A8J3TC31_9ACTN|nr:dethiobiotin synthase [Planosporangium mesophilum]NJC83627.1 ATP-dependent dethiobiotin synthetase BioD [Planosporangium mesophilum]GII22139.1 ATP-dependent dethiobiotin synthetase BioD [Planosporangium mesophilum]
MTPLRGPVIVTGTDTGVGKTIATAALAAAATEAGLRVAVVKPGQTGVATGEESDADAVTRLAAPATVRTLASYPDPLAPLTAARVAGLAPLVLADVLAGVEELAAAHELVLVEGAGGVLVSMGDGGWTIADLAIALGAPAVVVARAGLGTLNHTALTLEALDRRAVPARVVIGAWPQVPDLVHRTNLSDLTGELGGVVPDGAGGWQPAEFRRRAADWLAPELHGTFDAEKFRSQQASR